MSQPGNHLLHYSYVEDILERRTPHRDAHLALLSQWAAEGRLVAAGAVGSPPHGALIIFHVDDAAEVERYIAADPYVAAGLVREYRIEPWTVAVAAH